MSLPSLALGASLAVLAVGPALELRTLSSAEATEDFLLLTETLEREQAGLYRYARAEELHEAWGSTLHALEREIDVRAFFGRVAAELARVRCGHTSARLDEPDRRAILARAGLLPLELVVRGERAWVVRELADVPDLAAGDELASIEGLSIAEIRRAIHARLSADGFTETGKERELEADFARLFATFVDPRPDGDPDFAVVLAGASAALGVSALDPDAWDRERTRASEAPVIAFRVQEDTGILSVSEFGDGEGERFPERLAECFARLRADGVERLVIDLRGNGGGRDMYGALLVSYLAREPFRYFERIEVTPDYEGEGDVVERDGRRLVTAHRGLLEQAPAELAFRGRACLLIDGDTFSTAADVATVVHFLGLATLVGEETGGGYDGNTSGDSRRLVLPNSRITVNVPRWAYTTANAGHERHGRGAPAEIEVGATIEDVLAGRDPVLAAALAHLR